MGRRRRPAELAGAAGALPEAIAALSRALPAGPSPETFRRAKFDRPEAAPALWRLLFRVLSPPRADGASASRALEAQARWVKAALLTQGYPRLRLARLPDDGSQGSRELLLALSWLLARKPLLEPLLARTRVRLGDELPAFECGALASPSLPAPRLEADGPVDACHLQWLMGKLRFRWRNLMASQQEQCALLGKIHMYTRGCHSDCRLGHLSVAETELLRDPEGGRQLLRRLESENARLGAALEWWRRELVFWQWMVRGQGPEWSAARQAAQEATREAVGRELAALRQAWERGGGPQPHGPLRLVRTEAGAPGGPGLRAVEAIGALKSREACLEAALHQLQAQCRQQLARLAGALPGLLWIPPPGR
ncbi:tubulin epsilon and delta complex protein 1 isoform X2 [Pipistrellus kuhlii]|uniref:tubulin epsilon and delta complex protein 1 isoform X2 n=1 Tax=Pipistrellus kuhlii TaxID=59472 RepID=UPI00174EE4D8|nr:tubulin epsilon and delta complex protein 1 isoform X2 [Pipistrellus kuhlii]